MHSHGGCLVQMASLRQGLFRRSNLIPPTVKLIAYLSSHMEVHNLIPKTLWILPNSSLRDMHFKPFYWSYV